MTGYSIDRCGNVYCVIIYANGRQTLVGKYNKYTEAIKVLQMLKISLKQCDRLRAA